MNEKIKSDSTDEVNNNVCDMVDAGMLSREATADVRTIEDLWALAKAVGDIKGDPIWESLHQLGCNPVSLAGSGFEFDYSGYKGIYFPKKSRAGITRFVFPKLLPVAKKTSGELSDVINLANSYVSECKFIIIGEDVWLIHERFFSEKEEYTALIRHILENLKNGAELFYSLI